MKVIKRTSTLIACLFFALSISAQRPFHQGPRMGHQSFLDQLELSEDQKKALGELRQNHRKEIMDIRQDDQMVAEEKRAAVKSLGESFKAEVEALLTEDQKEQMNEHREELENKMERRKGQLEEKKAYFEKNVKPKLIELRKDFDEKISEEDKQVIADIRAEQETRKSKMRTQKPRRSGKISQSDSKLKPTEEQRSEMRDRAKTLKSLVAKYYEDIQDVLTENAELFSDWKEKMKPAQTESEQGPRRMHRQRRAMHGRSNLFGPEIRFLLMPTEDSDALGFERPTENRFNSTIKVFPNPSTKRMSISYDLENPGSVSIQILDSNGSVLQTHPQGNQSSGMHQVNLEDLGLSQGTYYIQVAGPDGKSTQKVVITN